MSSSVVFALLALLSACTMAVKFDCNNTKIVKEEHINYCCKHPDGPVGVLMECAKQTGFQLPDKNEEALEDIPVDRAITGTCFGKCVFEKLQFLKDDQLDMAAVKQYYNREYSDDTEYAKEMTNAFEHCHGKTEENTAKFKSSPIFKDNSEQFCDPKSVVIWACVVREFFCYCPANRQQKTEECATAFEFSKQCKDALTSL